MKRGSLWRWHRLRGRLNVGATEPVVKFGWESCAYPSCPKMRTEPKSRILEVLSKFAETSRRGTGDPLFTEAVRGLLRDSGVKPLRLPANSPNLNAYAERFVLSIRRECLDRFVPLSERHLRTAVTEYVVHYHTERNHQGLGNELITPLPTSANDAGPIVSRERLGGILNYYCRAA